jgi:nonsense-mediated mRNA decay protein 3
MADRKAKEERKKSLMEKLMLKQIKDISIILCPRCMSVTIHSKHHSQEKAYFALTREVISAISFNHEPDNVAVDIPDMAPKTGNLKVQLDLEKESDPKKQESYILDIPIEDRICDNCRKADGQYYEGILQIRGNNTSLLKKILDTIKTRVKKAQPEVFINRFSEQKNGYDFYLTSKNYLQKIAKSLLQEYGGTIKQSRKLYSRSRQTGKEIYRITVVLRLWDFLPGDILLIDNKPVLVRSISADSASIISIPDIRPKKIRVQEQPKKIADIDGLPVATVARTKPQLEVLDPDTFQPEVILNPEDTKEDKIRVLRFEGKLYMVCHGWL